jgi:hypothetical protein
LATVLESVTSYRQKTPWKVGTATPLMFLGHSTRLPLLKSTSSKVSSISCTRYRLPARQTLLELKGLSGSFRRSRALRAKKLLPTDFAPRMAKAMVTTSSLSLGYECVLDLPLSKGAECTYCQQLGCAATSRTLSYTTTGSRWAWISVVLLAGLGAATTGV